MSFVVVIPARYASTRLPGKPLADIHGKPMVQHVVEKALQSGADRVIVATDDERVQQALAACAGQAGFEVCMTSKDHQSGTERLAEVCRHYGFAADTIVVNVQGTSRSFRRLSSVRWRTTWPPPRRPWRPCRCRSRTPKRCSTRTPSRW